MLRRMLYGSMNRIVTTFVNGQSPIVSIYRGVTANFSDQFFPYLGLSLGHVLLIHSSRTRYLSGYVEKIQDFIV